MVEPFLSDEAFLADVESAPRSPDRLHVWWLGQSGFLLKCGDAHVLLDPYLSDSLTRKYAATNKPHVRMSKRVVAPEWLDFIDAVSISHLHTDHCDPDTLLPLMRANPLLDIIVPSAIVGDVAHRLGTDVHALHCQHMLDGYETHSGTEIEAKGIVFTGVASAHETLEVDEHGGHKCLGYLIQMNRWRVYHSGDTIIYEGLAEKLSRFSIDLALLPINGRAPERRVAGNLWGREAAALAKEIGAKLVVPCHYDMFEFNTATPDEFVDECERLGQAYRVLRLGERLTLG